MKVHGMEVGSHFDESVSCLASLAGTRSVVPMISSSIISYVALTVKPRRNQFTLSKYLSRVSSTYGKLEREYADESLQWKP